MTTDVVAAGVLMSDADSQVGDGTRVWRVEMKRKKDSEAGGDAGRLAQLENLVMGLTRQVGSMLHSTSCVPERAQILDTWSLAFGKEASL